MDTTAKVLIIERNCAQLFALTVWLKQFPEFDVQGTMSGENLQVSMEKNSALEYDLVIYGLEIGNSEELPIELARALSLVRKIKSRVNRPTIVVLSDYLTSTQPNNITAQIGQQLLRESDGQLCMNDSLKDVHHEITKLLSYRRATSILNAWAV